VAEQSSEPDGGTSAEGEKQEVSEATAGGGEADAPDSPGDSASDTLDPAAPESAGPNADDASDDSPTGQQTPAGWFQDPNVPNQQRYWDGSAWTDQTHPGEAGVSTTKRSADERKALLAQQIQSASARGLRVESQSDFQAVMVEGQPVNHVLHAIVTLFSCGLWGIVWIILAITGGEKREMVVVDEFGNVQLQKLGKA
jgi:hypothetical protein